ncbi:hypothetical protein CH63R_03094 [Colletotrichum higginsianum IMI 349063]|uniref:Uncharacterized protein n=1 Tax=Colletotrichum higginsianum (strain IMI 349063) TaxID=759273 RepID=A0A1B7YR39_COLHI|nr:hypothetical protein CH63R_03094 [Colletotrichum higginsianum IMI 349063]OBR14368.1 hypothetical protein CH63R_03094 [Colletotrichum higginsianum IMI 349063]
MCSTYGCRDPQTTWERTYTSIHAHGSYQTSPTSNPLQASSLARQVDVHRLHVLVSLQPALAQFPPDAALLHAAERHPNVRVIAAIHLHHAGLELPRDAVRHRQVPGEDGGAKPVRRVVGHRQRLLLGPEPHCGGGEFRDKRLVHSLVYEDARGGRADLPPRLLMMLSQEQRTARSRSALSKTIRGDLPAISSGDNFQGAGGEPHDLLTRGRAASEGHLVDARVSGEGGACLATVFVDDGDDAWRETGLLDQPHDGLVVVKVCRLELGTKSLSMKRPRGWAHVLPFGAARSAAGQRGEGAIGGNDKGSRRHSAGWSGHPGRMQQGGKGERTWFTSENERGGGERGEG